MKKKKITLLIKNILINIKIVIQFFNAHVHKLWIISIIFLLKKICYNKKENINNLLTRKKSNNDNYWYYRFNWNGKNNDFVNA